MAHVVVIDRMAFQKVKLDDAGNRTIEPDGNEVVVRKGNYVPDWVPPWQLAAFQQSGMIVPVADRPVFEPEPVGLGPVPPEVPPAPGDVLPPVERTDVVTDTGTPEAQPAPQGTESRATWEAYATSPQVGMTTEEAQAYPNKAALIDAVTARTQK